MQEKIRRCTQVVVRGRTRNAIGPQGRVGSTPTISARIFCPQGNVPLGAFFTMRPARDCPACTSGHPTLHCLSPIQHPGTENKEQEHDQQKGRKTPGSYMLGNKSKDHRCQHDTGVGESHFHADTRLRGFYSKKYRSEMGHVWKLRSVSKSYEK